MRKFTELYAQSCFSFLHGASDPEEMVKRAHELGYQSLGIIDRNGFYGMVRGFACARELSFPLLYGVEVELNGWPLAIIVKNFSGYKKICRLLTLGFQNRPKAQPLLTREQFSEWIHPNEHWVCLTPQIPSLLESTSASEVKNSRTPSPQETISFLQETCGPSLRQLVTKRWSPAFDRPLEKWIRDLNPEIPRVWTFAPKFHEASRFELFEVLRAIRTNTKLSELPASYNGESYLRPLSLLSKLKIPEEWILETERMRETCTFSPAEIRYHYPQEWLPEGKTAHEFLRELCSIGLQKRYPQGPSPEVLRQLAHELELVRDLKFEDYFLTVWDIVHFARSRQILCQGRGSAANSVICYLLEITSIDPIHMNLLFERFISRERNEAPDIDVDFEHERREEVIQYVYQKYGRHRAGLVATLITYRTRSALRDVGKALGISLNEPHGSSGDSAKDSPLHSRGIRLARLLKGFPRHLGQHAGGMILTADRLDEVSPIEPARMENRSIVQWDKYDIEKLGLLKIDLLSLGMLTCLRKAFELQAQHYPNEPALALHTIPAEDPKTFQMIQEARTVGVFQIESRAQMSMLPRLKPENFYDLVVEVAIVRPGPIQGGMVHPYLRRRMGLEPVSYAHPKLKPILEKTLGVPIFQEQVMKMAIEVAGYTPGEADALRRAMGAWKKRGCLDEHADKMCARMMAAGVPETFSRQVCDQILGFGEYGFPESHAASFALLTYASSYLKAHYPEVFLCALLNSLPMGFYSVHTLTSSAQREGVTILPIHTEFSHWDHRLERITSDTEVEGGATFDTARRTISPLAVRLGFRLVHGLQQAHVDEFVKKRQAGELDLHCFDRDERAALALLSEEADTRRPRYWKALDPGLRPQSFSPSFTSEPMRSKPLNFPQPLPSTRFPELSELGSISLDLEFSQTTIGRHPALVLREQAWHYGLPIRKLSLAAKLLSLTTQPSTPFRRLVHVFGMVQVIQSPPTAKGIFFITLEDETGFLNLVLYPDIYKKYRSLIQSQGSLLITGFLQNQNTSLSILVKHVHTPVSSSTLTHLPIRRHQFGQGPSSVGRIPQTVGFPHTKRP